MATVQHPRKSPTTSKGSSKPLPPFDLCVVGQGHIGLPTAVAFASAGLNVLGVDIQPELVDHLNNGDTHITEPGLQDSLRNTIKDGNYSAALKPEAASVFIVSVPTPIDENGKPVLDYVLAAAGSIGPHIQSGSLVILESTVPPGTTAGAFASALNDASQLNDSNYMVAHCPERVLPGQIMRELVHNDRVVGGLTVTASEAAVDLYRNFVTGEIVITDATSAELIKLSENIYRDVNIALANELAESAEELGVDIWQAIDIANRHPRVNIHQPGPGVGGYCIPVASLFLAAGADVSTPTIDGARQVNSSQPQRTVESITHLLKKFSDPVIAVLGVAYKGIVGDARATPANAIISGLTQAGATVKIHDPLSTNSNHDLVSLEDALDGADAVMFITDHNQFSDIDPTTAADLMRGRIVFDGRNIVNKQAWEDAGFTVTLLGDGTAKQTP
jgi:UDP-N-acetyl-D-mannosaminuronic acid dehydrogenase